MNETSTKTDKRIIGCLRRIIDVVQPQNASIRYDGAPANPLMGSQHYTTGMFAGRRRTLEELYDFLGEAGFIDYVTWTAFNDRVYMQIGIHHGGGALIVTNCSRTDARHCVGFRGAKWMPDSSTPDSEADPDKVRYHIVDTEAELISVVLGLIEPGDI